MRKIKNFLPHLCLSMALAMIVIVILNERNPMMAFLSSDTTKIYILLFCVVSVVSSVCFALSNRK